MTASKMIESGPVSTGGISHRPLFAVGAVLLGSFLANFDTRLFSVALPDLRGVYSLSFDEGAWLSTAATASQIAIAPAVAWLSTAFGLRRVLGIPSLIYAVISLLMPLAHDYSTLLVLSVIHGLMLGTFVPATLLIVFRNLPMKWWVLAIAIYSIRVGFSLNSGISLVGFYVDQIGWQWMFWQDVFIAPLMGLCVYLGTPHEPINHSVVTDADWGGMLLLGAGMAIVYAGLDQGNRLDWFGSGTVMALLCGGLLLAVGFFVNESLVRRPWADVDVILSRNIGLSLAVILLYTLTGLSNSTLAPNFLIVVGQLRPEQSGWLFLTWAILPMIILFPLSIYLIKYYDPRLALIIGLSAFAAAGLLGTQLTHDWSLDDFIPVVLLQSVGQSFSLLPLVMIALANSDPTRATAFAAYVQVMRLGGAEIGVALMTTWLRIREQFHSNLLGQHVGSGDADVVGVLSRLTALFSSHGTGTAQARGVGTLAALVQREANTLSYIDGFWLTVLFALLGLLCVALMTASPPGPFSPKPR
ncbi:MFS transporter [Bradyrhizobium sp. 48]|uniref:MFS transporter n=1 Tax=Bradyrhizobium sp. 48 TaxID=2782676 RepID=UPI001FFA151C|nr:MFS transporter [Bradyrhizobium sp. 48]MCK1446690.1 MFS transporter [Bradyrhizobium sp. 48]